VIQRFVGLLALLSIAVTSTAAAAPAAFTETAVTIPISVGTLSGTLTVPNGPGPFPAAVIIAGSGPTDRNGNDATILHGDAYLKLAHDLAMRGIATLRYDKRSVGKSAVSQGEADMRFDDFVKDALVMAKRLEGDKRFSSVSLIGHSEGSLIGIVAAQRDPHIRSVVSISGPGRDLATIIDEQIRANPNNPPQVISEVDTINASLLAGKTVADVPAYLNALFRPSVQPFLISEYKYDPAKEIAKLKIPVLILQGTHDIQVDVKDARLLSAADPRAKLVLIDGMNHMLVDAPMDRAANIATYNEPQLPLDPHLVPAIAAFLK
jgi:pimeloyl-ACP methyl ester carboxylesterase